MVSGPDLRVGPFAQLVPVGFVEVHAVMLGGGLDVRERDVTFRRR
jgi:hypothetical protein